MSNRKSGIKKGRDSFLDSDESLNLEEFIQPYINFQQEYKGILNKHEQKHKEKAFLVTFTSDSSLVYIAFTENKDKAKSIATKYFRDSFYPTFMGTEWKARFKESRTKRVREWDKYVSEKKVPVTEVMKLGASFPCFSCGSDAFSLKDVEDKRCFIMEDEGDTNPFTKGFVLCYNCYKKYINP